MTTRVVLAYSGGLDTSVSIPWLGERYQAEVITLTVDIGGGIDLEQVRQKALKTGAVKAIVLDTRDTFVREHVWPALKAGAVYEGQYPLATALGRPLIARLLVEVALKEGAAYVAHGSTGKGNDQVRFDVSVAALAPHLKVLAPAREWGMSREQEITYAQTHRIPVPATVQSPYSVDENLWGRSIEAGVLEDPWAEPPEEIYAWTRPAAAAPAEARYLEVTLERGAPVALDGEELGGVALINHLNQIAGEHGVGRIDHLENRLVGIKSREIYEAPAAVALHAAHRALETMTLTKDQLRFRERVAQEYADLVYNGLWFTHHRRNLDAYVESLQQHVSGTIRLRLHKGSCVVVGRRAPRSLYSFELATYDAADQFDHRAAEGFIKIYGLTVRTQARVQGQGPQDTPEGRP